METSNTPCYLLEPTELTTTGNLKGTSLRTYEVVIINDGKGRWNSTRPKPTGVMYTLKNDGTIKKTTTNATLSSKYLPDYNVQTHVNHRSYGCAVYASPELALMAKANAIDSLIKQRQAQLQAWLNDLALLESKFDHLPAFIDSYPELFI